MSKKMKTVSWDIRLLRAAARTYERRRVAAVGLILGAFIILVYHSIIFSKNILTVKEENSKDWIRLELPGYRFPTKDVMRTPELMARFRLKNNKNAATRSATQNKEVTKNKNKDHIPNPEDEKIKTKSQDSGNTTIEASTHSHGERFLIYVCNMTRGCYGLGDRQRGIASAFVLSLLTGRTFGIIWTRPSNLTDYYLPNKVNWIIPEHRLEGKTTGWAKFVAGKSVDIITIPFDRLFPQDVVYMITNMYILHKLPFMKTHRDRVPKNLRTVGAIWLHLMWPKPSLRNPLNAMLTEIAEEMIIDGQIQQHIYSSSCRKACKAHQLSTQLNKTETITTDLLDCVSELNKNFEEPLKRYNISSPNYMSSLCLNTTDGVSIQVPTDKTLETIKQARGFDVTNFGLVCVHIRYGRSKTLPDDVSFIKTMNGTDIFWDFLRPYVNKGRHVYLATDSEEVRLLGREKLGHRVHFSSTHVSHMDRKEKEKSSTAFAFWENMLLMTSCQTLLICNSGYGKWASSARDVLIGNQDSFIFTKGVIKSLG